MPFVRHITKISLAVGSIFFFIYKLIVSVQRSHYFRSSTKKVFQIFEKYENFGMKKSFFKIIFELQVFI